MSDTVHYCIDKERWEGGGMISQVKLSDLDNLQTAYGRYRAVMYISLRLVNCRMAKYCQSTRTTFLRFILLYRGPICRARRGVESLNICHSSNISACYLICLSFCLFSVYLKATLIRAALRALLKKKSHVGGYEGTRQDDR